MKENMSPKNLTLGILIFIGFCAGYFIVKHPLGMMGLTVLIALVFFILLARNNLTSIFIGCLAVGLTGYAFLGKGFAYLNFLYPVELFLGVPISQIPPVYVGEFLLLLGCLAFIINYDIFSIADGLISKILIVFMLICALQTFSYINQYGIDTLRDGVIWGYGMFALIIPLIIMSTATFFRVQHIYAHVIPFYLIWVIVVHIILLAGIDIPPLPFAGATKEIPIIALKYGDIAVHLAGIAAFLLLGLNKIDKIGSPEKGVYSGLSEWVWWVLWVVCVMIVASGNRGALLSIIIPFTTILFLRPLSRWNKPLLVIALCFLVLVALNLEFNTGYSRSIGPDQVVENFKSVFGKSSRPELTGTVEWRIRWWKDIVDYTVFGDYFWQGKGFGINLATDDGYQTFSDESLRSPHNGHMTILARSGVPGVLLWLFLQGFFAYQMISAYFRVNKSGNDHLAKIYLWILSYWAAYMVNGTFDVFLEGPQGGIWFWSLFGFGIAAIQIEEKQNSQ